MKRYLLFAGDQYYPRGGMYDLRGDFDTLEEAVEVASRGDALLKNNIDLDEKHGWSPEKAQAQHKKVMRLACDKLKVLFD